MDKDQMTTQSEIYIISSYILNSVSILFSLLLIITITILKVKEINFSNRISLRLIMYISIVEMFFSMVQMIKVDSRHSSMLISYMSSWGFIFSTLLICFLTASILINIQLTLIFNFKDVIHFKKYYTVISFSTAILLSVMPVFLDKFSYDRERNYYWYKTIAWEWMTYYGWITFSMLYCMISAIFVYYRLNKMTKTSQISPNDSNNSNNLPKQSSIQSKLLIKYISRITLYSLIPILSYSPTILLNLVYYYSDNNFFILDLLSLIFISSQSIFTFVIFLFDPIIDEAILEHKRNIEHKKNVLSNIKRGVYVNDIYKINIQSTSNRDQNGNKRNTIKNRISSITSIIYTNNRNRNDAKNNLFVNEEALYLL